MKILSRLTVLVLLAAVVSCGDGPVVATVGPESITLKEFNETCQRRAGLLGVEELSGADKRKVLDGLIQKKVAYLNAKERGIEVPEEKYEEATKDLSFFDRLRYGGRIRKGLLARRMMDQASVYERVTREDIEEYYRAHVDEFTRPEMFKVYLVKVTETNAFHVLSRARRQPDAFDDMALRTETEELRRINENAPYTPRDGFPDEMWPFLRKMKKGDIAGPVKVERGMFLFKLVDRKPAEVQPLKDAYFDVEHLVQAERKKAAFEKWYDRVKGNYKVEILMKELVEEEEGEAG